jgi:hypothetical protein
MQDNGFKIRVKSKAPHTSSTPHFGVLPTGQAGRLEFGRFAQKRVVYLFRIKQTA